jgi:glycosyltransferase involved in cell wall biosynthesis
MLEEVEEEETPRTGRGNVAQRFWKRIARLRRAEALRAVETLARTLPCLPESRRKARRRGGGRSRAHAYTLNSPAYGPDLLAKWRATRSWSAKGAHGAFRRDPRAPLDDVSGGLVAAVSEEAARRAPARFRAHRSGENVNERIRGIEQLGFDAADRVICVSHYTAGIAHSRYGVSQDKLRVVHNAVTHRELMEGTHAAKTIPEPIVLFLGRVTFQKGPDYFRGRRASSRSSRASSSG